MKIKSIQIFLVWEDGKISRAQRGLEDTIFSLINSKSMLD
jgi:hypothetical protein